MPLVTHQVEASLVHLAPFEDGTLDQCLMLGMSPTAWSPLGRGVLGSGSLEGLPPAVAARAARLHADLDSIAPSLGLDRAGTALAWVLRHPSHPIPVVGSVEPTRIASMARAAEVEMGREAWYRLLVASRGERVP
jgi:predicted oxidoreductase